MVDLNEPVKKLYSEREESEITKSFLVLVHSFLIFYLSVHNFILPLILNLLKNRDLTQDMHFWFLFHFPVQYWLRKGKPLSFSYNLFLLLGSLSRLIFYNTFLFSRSWTLVSVYLSEISSLIFCIVIWNFGRKDKLIILSFIGLLVPPLLAQFEMHPVEFKTLNTVQNIKSENYEHFGCRGSELTLSRENLPNVPFSETLQIMDCGFEVNTQRIGSHYTLLNSGPWDLNIRLYELIKRNGRFTWKFVRIMRLERNSSIELSPYLKHSTPYLLKSPERRKLGITVLIPKDFVPEGHFHFNLDGLNWSSHE